MIATRRFATGLLLMGVLTGCAGSRWDSSNPTVGYVAPRELQVKVVLPAAPVEDREALNQAVGLLTRALQDELAEKGIVARIVLDGSVPPPPAAYVAIVSWDAGSRGLRWLLGFGVGKATMNVAVDVRRAGDGARTFQGQVQGWVNGGTFGGSAVTTGEEAGKAIAYAIATGRAVDD